MAVGKSKKKASFKSEEFLQLVQDMVHMIKTSVKSEHDGREFLRMVQDLVHMVNESDDSGKSYLETIEDLLKVVETEISECYLKESCAKQYLTAEVMLIGLKARISDSCVNVESENSNVEVLVVESSLVQSQGIGENTDSPAGAVPGLLPPSQEELNLRNFVRRVQSLPPSGEQEMVRSQRTEQAGPTESGYARGVLGGRPRIYSLSSWGPVDAFLSQMDYSLWCCVNFDISGLWPFNDQFRD